MQPVRILGAGPAGLSAAIYLARHGAGVEVYEQRGDVGGRFHGDYQGMENWSSTQDVLEEVAEAGIAINFWHKPLQRGRVFNPRLRPLDVAAAAPLVYLVERGDGPGSLDRGLKEQAIEAGVTIHFNQTAKLEQVDIVATGPRGVDAIAHGITFETELEDMACSILSDRLAPKGYTYLLVAKGRATLATVLFEKLAKAPEYLDATIEVFDRLLGVDIGEHRRWSGYAKFGIPTSAVREGRLYAGEAGGFQDWLFGFGIRLAMASGILAARSILEGSDYDTLWKERLAPLLTAARRSRFLYAKLGRLAYQLLWYAVGTSTRPERIMRLLYLWRI